MEVAGGALAFLSRALDEAERLVERAAELVGDDVVRHRLCGVGIGHAFGEFQDEIALMHLFRDGDQVAQQRSLGLAHAAILRRRPRRGVTGGVHAATAASVMPSALASVCTKSTK